MMAKNKRLKHYKTIMRQGPYAIQNETMKEVIDILQEYKRCFLVRFPGFGKTHLFTNLAKYYGGRAIVLVPSSILMQRIQTYAKNIGYEGRVLKSTEYETWLSSENGNSILCCTYIHLVDLYKSGLIDELVRNASIIMCDEAHLTGAEKTYDVISYIQSTYPDIPMLGATATPTRTDLLTYEGFFGGGLANRRTMPSVLTWADAMDLGIIQRPYYVHVAEDIETEIKKEKKSYKKKKHIKDNDKFLDYIENVVESKEITLDIPSLFKKNVCTVYEKNEQKEFEASTAYLKFIVFCPTNTESMIQYEKIVTTMVKKAFPDMKVNSYMVASTQPEFMNQEEIVVNLPQCPGVIDLIFNMDIMTHGVHVENLTGIIMRRTTVSNIVYKQQVGRCLSVNEKKTSIIFDMVGNYQLNDLFYTDESNCNATESEQTNAKNGDMPQYEEVCLTKNDVIHVDETLSQEALLQRIHEAANNDYEMWVNAYLKYDDLSVMDCVRNGHFRDKEAFIEMLHILGRDLKDKDKDKDKEIA